MILEDLGAIYSNGYLVQIIDDQTLLSFHVHHAHLDRQNALRVSVLPRFRYPNGDVFFEQALCGTWRERCCEVVAVHNNFLKDLSGHDKEDRLRHWGLWFLEGIHVPAQCCAHPQRSAWELLLAAPTPVAY